MSHIATAQKERLAPLALAVKNFLRRDGRGDPGVADLRFDDSLETVLAAEMSTPFGAQSTWRQLVDLAGRRRVPAAGAVVRLQAIRAKVPVSVRAASARSLAFTDPPAALVALFATDEPAIAAPVLGVAQLRPDQWIEILPLMSPATRSLLRHRRDLHADVRRALESFGPSDFILPSSGPVGDEEANPALLATESGAGGHHAVEGIDSPAPPAEVLPVLVEQLPPSFNALAIDWTEVLGSDPSDPEERVVAEKQIDPVEAAPETPEQIAPPVTPIPLGETPFVSLASVVRGLPVVAEALSFTESSEVADKDDAGASGTAGSTTTIAPAGTVEANGGFEIADLVARIDAYKREREDAPLESAAYAVPAAAGFRFATDEAGVIRWVSGVERGPLVGLSLGVIPNAGAARVDGTASGAFRRRSNIANARLVIDGSSDAAGQWRISAGPVFDARSGRFTGYQGTARRPRVDEAVEQPDPSRNPEADALRQLVHELRTPTNAIAGFAEMIEGEMLGPVSSLYRDRAREIHKRTIDLIAAIDDIDLAARLETHALQLHTGTVSIPALLACVIADLAPLLSLRGAAIIENAPVTDVVASGDERAIERLVSRLLATLAGASSRGERLAVAVTQELPGVLTIAIDRPAALADQTDEALFAADAEAEAVEQGAPLLGTGFALRLVRNLATEMGGALTIGQDRLTLRLPAAFSSTVGQASSN